MTCFHSILFWFYTPRIEGNLLLLEICAVIGIYLTLNRVSVYNLNKFVLISLETNLVAQVQITFCCRLVCFLFLLLNGHNSAEFPNNSLWFAVSEIKEGFKGNGQDNLLLPMMEAGSLELMKCTLPSEPSR